MKRNTIAWIFQVLMGVLYIIASSGKITSQPEVIASFNDWGYPYGFYLIIGGLELLGGVLLFYPKTAGYASVILIAVMIGAALTHIVHNEGFVVLKPVAYMIGLIVVFYIRFIQDMQNDDAGHFPLNDAG
ncbi:MAG: DoxX family protein [Reichenbachiella sp.]|uniref:DoxX family protein n=1 Tax=Reichenbachiella sp. TaxID=2184521 RepID=UPI003266B4AB